ncbi:MAG TPA: hypothetical protein VFR67_06055 [Pilimelia sp.]|nr:hypothetical protein [Pilimelia sp.]
MSERQSTATTSPANAEPTNDYWLQLADDIRRAADRIATLAGTTRLPARVRLHIVGATPGNTDPAAAEVTEVVAAVFGARTHSATLSDGSSVYEARAGIGFLRIEADTYLPPGPPEVSELERLRARVAELEAQAGTDGPQ